MRHRLIANLHGAETLTVALGRLAAERPQDRFPSGVEWHRYRDFDMEKTSPQEIDQRYREAEKILKRVAEIDSRLAQIQQEGAAIKKHCPATRDEIRAEAEKHAKYLHDLYCLELGLAFGGRGRSIKAQAKAMMERRSPLAARCRITPSAFPAWDIRDSF